MKINIKATQIDLSDAINDYVLKKVSALEKFIREDQGEALAMVEVGKSTRHHKSGDVFRAEIRITGAGYDVYAVVEKDDLYAAIDEVKDEVARSLTSRRKKALALFRRGGTRIKEIIKNVNLRPWKRWKWRE